jgi:hypothetical protein
VSHSWYLSDIPVLTLQDSYTDIFSDFDPRPFDIRTLSDDFITECQKRIPVIRENDPAPELRLLIPQLKREKRLEPTILSRYYPGKHTEANL